jgi:hypothetical protein
VTVKGGARLSQNEPWQNKFKYGQVSVRRGLVRMSMSKSRSCSNYPDSKILHTTGAFLRLAIVMRNTVHIGSYL